MNRLRYAIHNFRHRKSWFWPLLESYRDPEGRTIPEVERFWRTNDTHWEPDETSEEFLITERWRRSPRPSYSVDALVKLIRREVHEPFTYLEFGSCFGTTLAQVLEAFPSSKGIGLEVVKERAMISQWVIDKRGLSRRAEVLAVGVTDAVLPPRSIDVVFMDTDHIYPDDYEYVLHLLNSGALKERFLFIGDDPFRTGTDLSRKRLIRELGDQFEIVTDARSSLFWLAPRQTVTP